MAICCARKSLPRDTKSPSATRVAEEMHFIPFARILDPSSFLLVSSLLPCSILPCYLFPAFSAYYCLKSNG